MKTTNAHDGCTACGGPTEYGACPSCDQDGKRGRMMDEADAAEAVRVGAGFCDLCGARWTEGPYCPACGVLATDSDKGRCPDCLALTVYDRTLDRWLHVNPRQACFLIPARSPEEAKP